MAAQPQPWIDQSLALLEQMENERGGLARALVEIEGRIEQIHRNVERTDLQLDELEERTERVQKVKKELREREEQIARLQEELWQRLMALRQDRERVRSAERRLSLDVAILENQSSGLPEELSAAETRRRELEHKLAHLNILRRDVAVELARLEVEMNRMVNQLEAMADAEETRDASEDPRPLGPAAVRGPKLRLVTDEETSTPTRSLRPLSLPITPDEPSRLTTLRFNGDLGPDSELFLDGDDDKSVRSRSSMTAPPAPSSAFEEDAAAAWDEDSRATERPGLSGHPWLAWLSVRKNQVVVGGMSLAIVGVLWASASVGHQDDPQASPGTAAASVVSVTPNSSASSSENVVVITSAPVEPDPDDLGVVAPAAPQATVLEAATPETRAAPSSSTERERRRSVAHPRAARAKRTNAAAAATESKGFGKVQLRADDDPLAGL